jgi:2-dehydro-3-deoxyglucarate aldolase/4-hydroxy-2-oxoheptanedioate aldolase
MMRKNPVKWTLASGGVALGTMAFEFNTTGLARLAASAGAEFIIFDQEHTGWSVETIRMLVATSGAADLVPMVRVPTTQYHLIACVLDVGARGIMVPMVESVEQARLIVQSAKYPPVGRRGAAFGVAHDDYAGGSVDEKIKSANDELLLIAQIESVAGVECVEALAAVDGIDVLWIGHFDLTNSMGIPAQFGHRRYLDAVTRVVAACRANGKATGIMAGSVQDAQQALDQGFRIVAYSGDLWLYQQALREGLATIRAHAGGEKLRGS